MDFRSYVWTDAIRRADLHGRILDTEDMFCVFEKIGTQRV